MGSHSANSNLKSDKIITKNRNCVTFNLIFGNLKWFVLHEPSFLTNNEELKKIYIYF